jgi:NAD(P)-dependent dehydrogenase (short-subunit alcohol dehydrogenase family)
MKNDFHGKAVLVTGGTKGIGLATGLAFGRQGAHVYLTHKWGSADEEEIRRRFAEAGAPPPAIVEADASVEEDTERLNALIREEHDRLEVLLSNVSFAQVGHGLESYLKRALSTSLSYSAWPLIGYMQQAKRTFGRYPRYVIGSSCDGPDTYYPGYDFVAASKVVMEVLCRYAATHLLGEDVRINILRSRPISTESLVATFGPEFEPFLKKYFGEEYFIEADEFAAAVLALCSGWMDAVSGQVILLDRGVGFCDNLMRLFEERQRFGLSAGAAPGSTAGDNR